MDKTSIITIFQCDNSWSALRSLPRTVSRDSCLALCQNYNCEGDNTPQMDQLGSQCVQESDINMLLPNPRDCLGTLTNYHSLPLSRRSILPITELKLLAECIH